MEVRLERSWMAVREEESGVKALLVSCSVCTHPHVGIEVGDGKRAPRPLVITDRTGKWILSDESLLGN